MSDRQRRYRQRQRRGQAVYRVAADDRVLLALLRSGRLTDTQALDRTQVEKEFADVLLQWALRWPE